MSETTMSENRRALQGTLNVLGAMFLVAGLGLDGGLAIGLVGVAVLSFAGAILTAFVRS